MARLIKVEFGRLLDVCDTNGNTRADWRTEYIGDGLIVLFEADREYENGSQFVRFYINEPEELYQRHITTSIGKRIEDDGATWAFLTRNSRYTFERKHSMSQLEAEELSLNVMHELGIDAFD